MDIPQFKEPGKPGGWLLEGESIEDGMLAIENRKKRAQEEKNRLAEMYRKTGAILDEGFLEGFLRDLKPDIPTVWEHLTVIDCANCGSNVIEFWRGSSGEISIHQQVQCCSEMKLAFAEDIPIQPIFER